MNAQVKLDEIYEDLSPMIGDITDDHVEIFWRDGLVHVPGFVKPELCEQVVERYKQWSGLRWDEWPAEPNEQKQFTDAIEKLGKREKLVFAIRQDDPWMFNYVCQRKFGEAAAKLLKVPSVKILSETLQVKQPEVSGHSRGLPWHQDFPNLPIDRAEAVQFWCALVPISVKMGPMIHLKGSHRSMPGGNMFVDQEGAMALYPELFEQFEPTKLEPVAQGEAVFHHALTWHMSGLNRTDKVRWAMSSYRVSARSRYTGGQNHNTDGLGLVWNDHFDHPNFPTVYP